MIRYFSTRGDTEEYTFSEVTLKGIANDGGLFIPNEIPPISIKQLSLLLGKSYQERALYLLKQFKTDFSSHVLKNIIYDAYGSNFDHGEIAPISKLKENQYLLELWHGPTSAFKDLALQIMPRFFQEAINKKNAKLVKKGKNQSRYLILVATSGDTGKAALEGYKNLNNILLMVFYPDGRVSQLQKLQMITQEGNNLKVYALKGNFDSVQSIVKEIFTDEYFSEQIEQYNTILSTANSINWGRLVPQVIYHINGYLDLVHAQEIKLGQLIDIAVPSGNFGNILAAYIAKLMGLPVNKLICASNENNVLVEFLRSGIYSIKDRSLITTSSPSMDILIASNIERLLYLITKNTEKVSQWMRDLKEKGRFEVDCEVKHVLQNDFYADWVSNTDCLNTIQRIYRETNYIMDPHTSIAQEVVEKYQINSKDKTPILICSTAHWAKFAKDVYKALLREEKPILDNEFEILATIKKLFPEAYIPKNISQLQSKKKRFNKSYPANKQQVEKLILQSLL